LSEAQLPRRYYGQKKKGEIDGFESSSLLHSKTAPRDQIVVGYGRRNPNEPRKRYGVYWIYCNAIIGLTI